MAGCGQGQGSGGQRLLADSNHRETQDSRVVVELGQIGDQVSCRAVESADGAVL